MYVNSYIIARYLAISYACMFKKLAMHVLIYAYVYMQCYLDSYRCYVQWVTVANFYSYIVTISNIHTYIDLQGTTNMIVSRKRRLVIYYWYHNALPIDYTLFLRTYVAMFLVTVLFADNTVDIDIFLLRKWASY